LLVVNDRLAVAHADDEAERLGDAERVSGADAEREAVTLSVGDDVGDGVGAALPMQ
jgi:hypothetical protein